jgi:phytoene dehydrogenase-like protein
VDAQDAAAAGEPLTVISGGRYEPGRRARSWRSLPSINSAVRVYLSVWRAAPGGDLHGGGSPPNWESYIAKNRDVFKSDQPPAAPKR